MVVIEIPRDEKKEELLGELLEHLNQFKEENSELRKKGHDTKMVDLLMMDIPARVRLARVAYDESEIEAIKKGLAQIRHELDSVKEGTEFDEALLKLMMANEHLRHGRVRDAQLSYRELQKVYGVLPEDLKKVLYKAAYDLHKKIDKAKSA